MRYLAIIKYDGSKFEGFQRLNNGKGVQNEIENVLSIIAKRKVEIKGAGRTDRKVHALGQAISFDLDMDITLSKLKYVMNRLLNPYVSVLRIQNVDDTFHARYSAKEKTYVYKAYYGRRKKQKVSPCSLKRLSEHFAAKPADKAPSCDGAPKIAVKHDVA